MRPLTLTQCLSRIQLGIESGVLQGLGSTTNMWACFAPIKMIKRTWVDFPQDGQPRTSWARVRRDVHTSSATSVPLRGSSAATQRHAQLIQINSLCFTSVQFDSNKFLSNQIQVH